MKYKLGSLFDGSGGFPLAGSLCGIDPVWAAEVEPYPIAVTRSRFPNMRHLGDISKVNGAEIEAVDIITFGSPCQDLSVAGKRAGLKHEANGDEETTRSGLFMEAVRIIKEMREATNGEYPTFALWENVPGAFSSNKGEDFRIVCEELIKIVEPSAVMPEVPKNGWPYADSYIGDGWSLAYRVFDAQYWGVPQRRRRIHLVVDFRGERAREVLFERKGVRGYFETGRTPWQSLAGTAQNCAGADDWEGASPEGYGGRLDAVGAFNQLSQSAVYKQDEISVSLTVCGGSNGKGWKEDTSYTLDTIDRHAVVYAEQPICVADHPTPKIDEKGKAFTLNSRDYKAPLCVVNQEVFRQGGFANYVEGEVGTLKASGGDLGGGSKNLIAERRVHYIVRRLTPTECARLQGFADRWGDIDKKDSFTDEEFQFWHDVRNTHAAINGKKVQEYTEKQMLTWYNKLHTDSAEYKMWGNGIALPPALYCMQGIVDALEGKRESCAFDTERQMTIWDFPEVLP